MPEPAGFTSRLFITGSLAFVLIGALGAAYAVALPAFSRAFDLPSGAAALILSTHATGGVLAVLAMTAGVRGLSKPVSMLLMAAGAGLIAAQLAWPVMLLGSLIAGAGFGLIATHVNRSFLTGFGMRGPGMVGLVNAVSGVGLIATPLIFVWLGGNAMLMFGAIALMALTVLVLLPRGADAEPGPRGLPRLRQAQMGILLLNHLSAGLETALAGLGVTALIAMGWAESDAARLASGFFAALLLSRLSLYWLMRVISPGMLFLIGIIGTALTAGIAALGWPALGYVMAGAAVGLAFPAYFVWGARVLGPDPRMSAAMLLSGLTGGAVGPLAFGALLGVIGLPNLFAAVAVLAALLALAIALTLARTLTPAQGAALQDGH